MAATPRRWRRVLDDLEIVERRLGMRRPLCPATYRAHGPWSVRRGVASKAVPPVLHDSVAPPARRGERIRARARADIVRLGKFASDDDMRLQAFYLRARTPFAVRLQHHDDLVAPGVARAVEARLRVADHSPGLAPTLIDYDIPAGPGVAFLRENVVPGRSPADRGETMRLAGPVAEALARLHRGVGVAQYPLSKVVRGPFAERWQRFAAEGDLSGALTRKILDLIERDGDVAVSLCHGDLVASNVLLTDQTETGAALSRSGAGFVLIDWEHARPGSIAFDLAKLHLAARHPDRALRAMRLALRDTFGLSSPTSSYQLEEQFALAHARMLTWHEHRRARAVAASRLEQLEADTRRRLTVLEDLMS